MKVEHPKVVLTARDAAGRIVHELELSCYDWYEGEVPLIDSDEECRRLSVRSIEVDQTDTEGRIVRKWKNTYDAEGGLEDLELLYDNWKPSTPPPPPGQSALDQFRRLGLWPPKRPPERQEDEGQLDLEL